MKDVFKLNWGNVTPEGVDSKKNTAVHIINHDLTSNENIERNIQFIVGRIIWFNYHLPKGMKQKIIIDARGQNLIYSRLKKIKSSIIDKANFVSVEFIT